MGDRQTKVVLSAQVSNYKAGMQEAAKATRDLGSASEKLAQQRQAFEQLGRTGIVLGAAIGAGVGLAVAKFADFDEAISHVAATGEDARGSLEGLRQAALDAGAETVFSATESANAIEELAKAGVSASDILGGGLAGALDLAAAGGLGVADAAAVSATALKQFELNGEDASHVADLLAAGAGKAMGDVSDMGQALNQAGLVANQFGLSIEETVGTLSAFASAGMLGSDAGTSMRTMLLRLANPTEEVKTLMKDLGIEAYDAGGNFIGLSGLAGELETGLAGMTQAQKDTTLAMIFGQDAIRGANILLREGAEGIDEWTAKVDDQGYAAETAATRLDNLKGDLEQLGGAFETALISSGSAANDTLRFLTQAATEGVDVFNAMPGPVQGASLGVAALASAALLGGGAFFTLVPKVAEFNAALATMGPGAQRAGRALGALGRGAGIAAAIATAVTLAASAVVDYGRAARGTDEAVAKATTTNLGFLDSMDELGVSVEASADSVVRALDAIASGNTLGPVGGDVLTLRDALTELGDGLTQIPLDDAVAKFRDWGDELGLTESQLSTMLDETPKLKDAIRDYLQSTGEAADNQAILNYVMADAKAPTDDAAASIDGLAEQADVAAENLTAMEDALSEIASTAMTMGEAMDSAQGSVNDLAAAASAEGAALYGTNDASIALRDSMREVETSFRDSAVAMLENGKSHEEAMAEWSRGREEIIRQREAMGESREEAVRWADENLGSAAEVEQAMRGVKTAVENIPARKAVTLVADTVAAMATINQFVFDNSGRRINLYVDGYVGRRVAGSDVVARAEGGAVRGPGTATSDSIPAMLSNGEHVWTAAEVNAAGGHGAMEAMRKWVKTGARFAQGGPVGTASATGVVTGVVELGPRSMRALAREVVNIVNIGDQSVASAANRGNANQAWRGGSA